MKKKTKLVALIPARSGSIRLKNKNILILSVIDLSSLGGSKLIKQKGYKIRQNKKKINSIHLIRKIKSS